MSLMSRGFAAALALAGALAIGTGAADAQRQLTIGTNPVGTGYHTVGSGMAALLTEQIGIPVVVQPFSGSSVYIPLLQEGEVTMGFVSSLDAGGAYRGGQGPSHVRLLDGGLTDNIGITGFALERAAADTPHGPLSPEEAVKLDRLLYIVADAGRERAPTWGASPQGPGLPDLLAAVSDTSITSSTREGFDALELEMAHWRNEIVRYRCGLSMAEIRRHRGTLDGWDCRNVRLAVEHVSIRSLDAETKARLDQVPTRLSLQQAEVDFVIEAGRRAIRSNPSVRDALAHIQRKAGVSREHAWR